ncbi:MAG TPA: M42 family metallopeptidase [Clostridia bacterium]|nr:M42 family metallopeptidase [Clostridia bacterium]
MFKDMIKTIVEAYGPSGRERAAGEVIKSFVAPHADKVYYDALGNLIAYKKGTSGKKIMLATHMDQIGLIVTHIDDKGFLRVSNVGGVSPTVSIAREVMFENGTRGVTYFETEKKAIGEAGMAELFIDIGAASKEEAEAKVEIGDVAVYAPHFFEMGRFIACGALDDRLCCAIAAEAFNTVKTTHDVYAVFTVQEEVGCRGAGPAAYAIEPDLAIALDVTRTGDTPKSSLMSVTAGKGPTIKVMDSSVIVPVSVREFLKKCAEENKIPYQYEVLRAGGTDTSTIQRSKDGVLAGCISVGTRYIHSPAEVASMDDTENAVKLLKAALKQKVLPQA